jgi:hypothetical protein
MAMSADRGETVSLPDATVNATPDSPKALAEPLRGDVHVTASMEMLQTGYLHAVAAAAGCAVGKPLPDVHGIDWVQPTRR